MRKPNRRDMKRRVEDKVESKPITRETTYDEDLKEIQEFENATPIIVQRCQCGQIRMRTSNVCLKCYESISNTMSKTVTKDESAPIKLYDATARLNKLLGE